MSPRDKRAFASVAMWFAVCATLVGFSVYLYGCAQTPTPAQQLDVASYQTEQLACVRSHATRKEIDVCRDMVKARHGRLDAGVPDGI